MVKKKNNNDKRLLLGFTDSIGSTKKYLAPKIWRKFSLGRNLDHSNKRCWVLLASGIVYSAVQGGSNIWVCGWNPKVRPFKWKLVLSCGIVYYVARGGSNIWVCGWNPEVWPFKWKLLSSTFLWYCLLCCVRWFLLLSLWLLSSSVTIQMKVTKQTCLSYSLLCSTGG